MSEQHSEQYEFKAEIKKLLDIIIHSLYTHKEIFLRELISNASDALDKARFEQSRSTEMAGADAELAITITTDAEGKRLTITDSGIGMDKDEVVDNIGTIAHSGSAEFLRKVAEDQAQPDNIIGQFGVGFYSVFMVAAEVTLTSRSHHPDAKPVRWHSDGLGSYTIEELDEDLPRGTSIEIVLREGEEEYAEKERIEAIIKRHSNFISFPIFVDGEKVNTIPALWREPRFNVKKEQYTEFYKFLTYDTEEPFETLHISVDAPVQFNALLFIPQKSPMLFDVNNIEYGLDLYVRRVLIQRENKELLPQYLGFIKGVVDTEDLPLNISRENIQENVLIRKIAANIHKQILDRLLKIASNEPERYEQFWREHNKLFKLAYAQFEHQDKIKDLVRFNSSHCEDASGLVSLQDYVERMPEGQNEIYYISGQSREAIESSPHLEILKRKNLEVLYLFEPIDEFVLESLRAYGEHAFVAAEHADPAKLEAISSAEEESKEELTEEEQRDIDGLLKAMQDILGDRVTEVRSSKRLHNSPACLVNPDGGMSSQMQKIMHLVNKDESIPQKVLEINPQHQLTRNLLHIYQQEGSNDFIRKTTEQLFESALLLEGYLNDPHALVNRTFELLQQSSGWYAEAHQKE